MYYLFKDIHKSVESTVSICWAIQVITARNEHAAGTTARALIRAMCGGRESEEREGGEGGGIGKGLLNEW